MRCYNAARVGPDNLLIFRPEVLSQDFQVPAVSDDVEREERIARHWFAKNANKSGVSHGERPLLYGTDRMLHKAGSTSCSYSTFHD